MPRAGREHKDRLFKFIFGNPEHKELTLSLYNALNNSHYTDPEQITFNTIEDAVYLGMHNDVSFIIVNSMNLWEHQASYNPNLPVRFLIYAGSIYDKYLNDNNIYRYGTVLHELPKPRCVCFYNGTDEQPEEQVLRLSDAFGDEDTKADIEVSVLMLNINYGRNKALMEECSAMNEYAWFIEEIRENQKVMKNLDEAVDAAIDSMPDSFKLKRFLRAHKAEVKGMYLTEYDEEKERRLACEEASMIGREEGRAEGRAEANERVATDMLRENFPLAMIEKISRLSEEAIRKLAQSLGIAIV